MIGTGASAIQFVPEIVDRVEHLTLFQRTASWVLPKHDRAVSRIERALFRAFPSTQKLVRGAVYAQKEGYVVGMAHQLWLLRLFQRRAEAYLRAQVPDDGLRAALTPAFTITCKADSALQRLAAHTHAPRRDRGVVGPDRCHRDRSDRRHGQRVSGRRNHLRHRLHPHRAARRPARRGADGRTLAEHW